MKDAKFDRKDNFKGQVRSGNYLVMDTWFLPKLGDRLQGLIANQLFHRPVFMARFRGGCRSCVAHIDSASTYNFYYVNQGTKRVTLIPVEHSEFVELASGHNSVYLPGSDQDDAVGVQCPNFYKFEISVGDGCTSLKI